MVLLYCVLSIRSIFNCSASNTMCRQTTPKRGSYFLCKHNCASIITGSSDTGTRKSSLCAEKAAWHEVTRYKMAMATVDRTVHTQSMSKTMSICNGENNTCTRIVCSVWLRWFKQVSSDISAIASLCIRLSRHFYVMRINPFGVG